MCASSTPVSVMILNVEPGGCRLFEADPRDGEDLPGRGLHRDDPARAATPSAVTAACCTAGEIARAHGVAPRAARRCEHAPARASSSPPGVPRRRASSARSRPLVPTTASDGTPCASSAVRRELGIGPTSPTTALAGSPSGELRGPAGVCGSFREHGAVAGEQRRPSRKRRAAAELLAGTHAREGERARPVDLRGAFCVARDLDVEGQRERAEQARRDAHGHRRRAPSAQRARLAGDAHARGGRGAHRLRGRRRRTRRRRASAATRGVDLASTSRAYSPRAHGATKLLRERVRRRGAAVGADDRADREGHGGERDHRARALDPKRLLFAQGTVEHGG